MFGPDYAATYDIVYAEKPYSVECDVIEETFHRFAKNPVQTILDLGCGTGNHAIELAGRGYRVTGVDRSTGMLDVARIKVRQLGLSAEFHESDIRSLSLADRFDAAILMFAVLGYQIENDDLLATLDSARKHLKPGGLLIFDFWYGPAVLTKRPHDRLRLIESGSTTLLRASGGVIDLQRQICTVDIKLWLLRDNELVSRTQELHQMRFFFPKELELLCDQSSFALETVADFSPGFALPDEATWNALVIARAV